MGMNKNIMFLAMILFSVTCMSCDDESRNYVAKSVWNYMTFKGFQHPEAQKYRKSFYQIRPLNDNSLQRDFKSNNCLITCDKNIELNHFNDNYNPINFQRTHIALLVWASSTMIHAASWYFMPQGGDEEARKVQVRAGTMAATSFAAALGLGWKSRIDVDRAIQAAKDYAAEKVD